MARKPYEITVASLQQYRDDLQGEYNELEEKQEGETNNIIRDHYEDKMEELQVKMDSIDAALEAINDIE